MEQEPISSRRPVRLWALLCITVTVAVCSILYELIIAQTLSLLAANTVIWFSVTVGLFLLGMGFGSFLSGRIRSESAPWQALIHVELALCLVGALAAPAIHAGHMAANFLIINGPVLLYPISFFGVAFVFTLVIGMLTGIELPLLMRIGKHLSDDPQIAYRVLGVDYLGSLVGALLFPLALLPHLEVISIGLLVASLNMAVAALLIWKHRAASFPAFARAGVAIILAGALLTCLIRLSPINDYFLHKYYYSTALSLNSKWAELFSTEPKFEEVFRARSPYQKIDLVKDPAPDPTEFFIDAFSTKFQRNPDYPKQQTLFLNGDFQVTSSYDEIYHEYFAHVPVFARGEVPRNILVLGGGDGLLIKELVKYAEVERITHVDLDRVLVGLARNHPVLTKMNGRSLHDPRVEAVFGDAYQYVRRNDEIYDAVYIDFPAPNDYDLAKLYSREFFHFVGERIAEDGFIAFDATGIGFLTLPDRQGNQFVEIDNDWPVYYATLKAAGFEVIRPFITTLEHDNPEAIRMLSQPEAEFSVPFELMQLLEFVDNENEDKIATDLVIRMARHFMIAEHIAPLQQGFILLGKDATVLNGEFDHDPGIELHVLNPKRFQLAFAVKFPEDESADPEKTNSIMRPTFPTIPFWEPRSAF